MPIVMLSSVEHAMTRTAREGLEGCETVLKPLRSAHLKQVLGRVLNGAQEPSVVAAPVAIPQPATDRIKLLMAEDNRTNQLVVTRMLKDAGFDITIAANGAEAVECYRNTLPDIVLMDMMMPVMDGVEATLKIREIEFKLQQRNCPIIALTANALESHREKCLAAGMDDFISKPIKKKALIRAINKWVNTPEERKTGTLAHRS
jgi:CheY-like chemotaxis protein